MKENNPEPQSRGEHVDALMSTSPTTVCMKTLAAIATAQHFFCDVPENETAAARFELWANAEDFDNIEGSDALYGLYESWPLLEVWEGMETMSDNIIQIFNTLAIDAARKGKEG